MARSDIIAHVKSITGMVVQTGPFAGMHLNDVQTWGNGDDIGPQLLGIYEQELHATIQQFAAKRPTFVINVGCAEGYYAVGLARLLPFARIYAFDIDDRAQQACRANADLNHVSDRVVVEGACSVERLAELAAIDSNILALIDCEGAETALLCSPTSVQALAAASIIVETHANAERDTTPALVDRFFASHRLRIIQAGARNPHTFPFLDRFCDADKWMLVCENRPRLQAWLACESKQVAYSSSA